MANRDLPNQHPIDAIEGLKDALDGKADKPSDVTEVIVDNQNGEDSNMQSFSYTLPTDNTVVTVDGWGYPESIIMNASFDEYEGWQGDSYGLQVDGSSITLPDFLSEDAKAQWKAGSTIVVRYNSDIITSAVATYPASADSGLIDHSALLNRDLPDQHPMSAITGLEEALANAGGGSGEWKLVKEFTTTEEVALFETDVNIKGEVLVFFVAAPTKTNTAKGITQMIINGTHMGHIAESIYTETYYTRRYIHVGDLPDGIISYHSGFGYNTSGNVEDSWTSMKGGYVRYDFFLNSVKENGILKVGYYSGSSCVFGIGSKIVVYARGL
jgi:hypothetical protein